MLVRRKLTRCGRLDCSGKKGDNGAKKDSGDKKFRAFRSGCFKYRKPTRGKIRPDFSFIERCLSSDTGRVEVVIHMVVTKEGELRHDGLHGVREHDANRSSVVEFGSNLQKKEFEMVGEPRWIIKRKQEERPS